MSSLALPLRVFEYWLLQYRRVWRGSAITSIVNPVFYLGALGVGLGTLVNKSSGASLGVPYIDFVAPGMLAATAMTIASGEASWPVMGAIKWTRQYFAMLATPLGILALPAAVLVGAAFTTPFAAYAATADSDAAFVPINRFIVVPMFLFSGTFFPVSRLPLPLEWLAYATPLWHGVELCRMFTLGDVHVVRALGHAAYLLLFVVIGFLWAQRTYASRLLK